jgi:glutathione S-transferase
LRSRSPEADRDIDRLTALWRDCRSRSEANGPFLFGPFCNADAVFAPVVTRFQTYSVEMDPICRAYADAILAWPAVREWYAAAAAEPWLIPEYEVA